MSDPIAEAGVKNVTNYTPYTPSTPQPQDGQNLQGSNSVGKIETPPPAFPTTPPPPENIHSVEKVIATVQLENGEIINITEKDLNLDPELSPLHRIQTKYETMVRKMTEAKEKGTPVEFIIYDPTLEVLYLINIALANDLPEEVFNQIGNRILNLNNCAEKSYLLIIFAVLLLASGKIPPKKAEELIETAVQQDPQNPEVYYEAYKFYLSLGNIDKAQELIEKALKLSPDNPRLLLEMGQFFVLRSDQDKALKKYDQALSWLDKAENVFKQILTIKPEFNLFLADLNRKRAEIYLLQDKARKAYDTAVLAVEIYHSTLEKISDNPTLYLQLVNVYLLLIEINKKLPGYQGYLEYDQIKCHLKAKATLRKAEKISQERAELLPEIAQFYLALGEINQAIVLLKEASQRLPEDPTIFLQLGDVFLTNGEIEESFNYWEKAVTLAEKKKNIDLLIEIHLRFTFLKMETQLALARKKTTKPNFLQIGLNIVGFAFLTYLNPLLSISSMLGSGIQGIQSKNWSAEELEKIVEKAITFERRSFDQILTLAKAGKKTEVFFRIALTVLAQANAFLKQIKELEKGLAQREEIEVYQEIIKEIKEQALNIFKFTLNKSLNQELEAEFKATNDFQKKLEIAQTYFLLYFFLAEKSEDEDIDPELKKLMVQKKREAFEIGIITLKKIIEFGEKSKSPPCTIAVFQFAGKLLDIFEKKFPPKNKKELEGKKQKLTKIMTLALKTTIEIAKENKDLETLLELGKSIYVLGPFSQKALEEAIELASDDPQMLFRIGNLLSKLQMIEEEEKEEENLTKTIEIKEILRKLAISVYQKIAEITEGEEKIFAYRQLWILGDLHSAYSGYVSLVEEYVSLVKKKAKFNNEVLASLYYELGLMASALGKNEEAVRWFKEALKIETNPQRKSAIRFELKHLKSGQPPETFVVKNQTSLSPSQIRSVMALYASWAGKETSLELLEQSVANLYTANHKRAKVEIEVQDDKIEVLVQEQTIDAIEIRGNKKTKTEVILRELDYAGLSPGTPLSTDLSQISNQISEASNRIQTFLIKDVRLVKKDGQTILQVEVEEPTMWKSEIGGGGGNGQAFTKISLGYNNLFGGGEKIGLDFSYHWFFAKGLPHYHTWNGKIYYFDPHIFVLGKKTPVSGGFDLSYQPRMNYKEGILEKITGGSITMGIKVAPRTTLSTSIQLYHVQGNNSYFQPSLRIALEKDGRDNWLFPNSGYYFITSVEPGMYLTPSGNQSFMRNTNEARFYIPLPLGMTLALRGVAGFGYNLIGGDQYLLSGDIFNPYVRASKANPKFGPVIFAGSMELRTPAFDLEYAKIQPYAFGDIGGIPTRGFAFGIGGGIRVALPVFGIVNIGYGWPGGFFIWFGNLGWN